MKKKTDTSKVFDYLIVGSGLFGATFAYFAKRAGKSCLVIEKRPHLGGNIYCENIEGINVHKYGAHIFHTSNKKIWDFVNSIVPFNRYTNSPIANYEGHLYNLPFNMNTFHQLWGVTNPEDASAIINKQRKEIKTLLKGEEPSNLEEQALSMVGKDIFNKLIKEYTEKQWGRSCKDLPPFIIKRLPLRFTFDNNYFNDTYQGIPIGGYNKLIEGLLDGVETNVCIDFFEDKEYWKSIAKKIVFTGQIDAFYKYKFGKLDYRTVRFETEIKDTPNFQGNAVVNYTSHQQPYTRIIEHKHFEMFGDDVYCYPKTVISKEYSEEWKDGKEPFYPINDSRNTQIYQQYKELAEAEENVIFGGRLAEYSYYDMAPVIEKAIETVKKQAV